MGKTSKKSNQILNGSYSISGGPSATYQNGNVSYKLTPSMQNSFDYAQKSLAENLPQINIFSKETLDSLNKEVDAYKNIALKELNSIYLPMLNATKNDAAKRFGNLDNSVYLQNLDNVEEKRANAVSTLAQDVAAKQSELIDNEISNRYAYLNFMNAIQNQYMNDALNAAQMAKAGTNTYAQYQNNSSSSNVNTAAQLASIMASIGKIFSSLE